MESVNSNTVLTVGQNLDVKDSVNKWVNAEVLRVNSYEIYVHYSGWAQRYDEPIPIDSPRILVQW